jgi:uncharacterized protein YjbI with pentapeptide repeats
MWDAAVLPSPPFLLTIASRSGNGGSGLANDDEHLALLRRDLEAWNAWRVENPDIRPELLGANLSGENLAAANLTGANLATADLSGANLARADLSGADLSGANLSGATLVDADLTGASLINAFLVDADLREADLTGAYLQAAVLNDADLSKANLTGCFIHGISAWGLKLEGTTQHNLVITSIFDPEITVDNIEVAQFIYLLLHNAKIRDVIDTITSKAVLILGRFTPERKKVLDTLRAELRKHDRTPIIFDFDQTGNKNVTDTVKLLAQLARYIIVDLSDPNSSPYELGVISMLGLDSTPVVPLIVEHQRPFPMLANVLNKPWCTELITYKDVEISRHNSTRSS